MQTQHPIDHINNALAFIGREVEGVVCFNLQTLILRAAVDELTWKQCLATKPQQIFLTEEFESWDWLQRVVMPWAEQHNVFVTVGRLDSQVDSFFEMPLSSRLRLVVRLWGCPWHKLLRPTDEVSIGNVYDMITLPISAGHQTSPIDYEQDERIEA